MPGVKSSVKILKKIFSGQIGPLIVVMSELLGVDYLASFQGFYYLFAAVGFL